jgi:hypothetical protein
MFGQNSSAPTARIGHSSSDFWLIWDIWPVAGPSLADMVPVEEDHVSDGDEVCVLLRCMHFVQTQIVIGNKQVTMPVN